MEENISRLERVELRKAWSSEPGDFTPWLAQEENLKLLGDTIGIELELVAKEKAVGSFYADIVCRDTLDGSMVLIENQLERTDHMHIGQLITYASGLDAVTIIWVAKQIADEHRAALDWLNSITMEGFNFFGLEIELWRIGDSDIAAKFNIVSKPNDWTQRVHSGIDKQLSPAQELQLDFWTEFKVHVEEQGSIITPTKPQPHNWMPFALGRTGFMLCAVASTWDSEAGSYDSNEIRAEIYIQGESAKAHFEKLEAFKSDIERELDELPTWYNPHDKLACKIYLRKSIALDDRGNWPEQHAWLLEKLEKLHRAFSGRIREL